MNRRDIMFHAAAIAVAAVALCAVPIRAQQREPKLDPQGEQARIEQLQRQGAASAANRSSGEDVLGRQAWFAYVRRFPYDLVPADLRTEALRNMERQTAQLEQAMHGKRWNAGVLAASTWQEIGPYNISGRTRALAFKPGDPQTMYIGAAAGGLWKTVDGGQNWTTTTDTLSSLAVCAIGIDHSNPNIIYIGTGENSANTDAYDGDGLFKSTDGGVTWKSIGLQNVGAFSKIIVHRQNPQIVYAAGAKSNGGFYRSEDGGQTWKSASVAGNIWDIAINPSNSNEVYLTLSTSVRRSTDGGKTFTTVSSGNGMNLSASYRISLAVSPARPQRLYALVARDPGNGGNHIGEAYVSDNSGMSWTLKKTFDSFFFNMQGWYDNCAAADPTDPDVALLGGIDVYRTADGGNSWTNTTRSYFGGSTHPDQHVLAFDDETPGLALLGNDGGVYDSFDGGSSWQKISTSLSTSQFYAIDVDQTRQFRVYGGTQDNGSYGSNGSSDYPKAWRNMLGGDGFFMVVDQADPNYVYGEQFNGTPLYRINANNPNSRTRIDGSISADAQTGDFGVWNTPIAMSPVDKKSLYTGRSKLYHSTNNGNSWEALTPNAGGKIVAIGLSRFDAKKLMVGSVAARLKYSLDGGANWLDPQGVPNRLASDIIYDPVNPDRVYVTFSGFGAGHVFRSDDDGAHFTDITSNIPDISVNALAVDPADPTHLFIGTDVGVYMSFDAGGTWVPFSAGLALSPVVDLQIQAQTHVLVAGTHGRSAWTVNISGLQPPPVLISPVSGQTISTPGTLVVRWGNIPGPVRILISYDGGKTYHLLADGADGGVDSFDLGLLRTSMARIRIVEIGGAGRSVESGNFSLTAPSNCQDLGTRGFRAEAIEYRQGTIWATVGGTDSLYRLKLPLLGGRSGIVRTNIPGHVRDMAYDATLDIFYMLVTDDDYSNPKLYRMDTTATGHGEVTLPPDLLHASGVAMTVDGIAIITPGNTGKVYVIKDDGSVVKTIGPMDGAADNDRRALVWDQLGFVQGVVRSDPALLFPSQLQHMSVDPALRVNEATTLIPPSALRFDFFGLALDPSNPDVNLRTYWATDTSGLWCKCERQKFFTSSVEAAPAITGYSAHDLALGAITPNPVRDAADILCIVRTRSVYTIEVFDAAGLRVAVPFAGSIEPGERTFHFDVSGLASGLYYISLSSAAGERDARPLVVVR